MHDLDIDKELADLIASVRSRSNDTQHGMLTAAIERVLEDPKRLDDPVPGTDLVPYEPAREVATLTESGVLDTASLATFRAEVMAELAEIVHTVRTHPLTAKTPEFRVEAQNRLERAVEALERATQ